jgi:ATP-dependent exoDNAse (exonuclease V) alpha subunit
MAIYYLNIKTLGRGAGARATSAAAYRAGERIRDERTGAVFDHSQRTDVMSKEIVLPSKLAATAMNWICDRSSLWTAAEAAEPRKNARVAREYLVALPHEMTAAQRLHLVQRFSQDLADRHGFAVDFAIHAPRTNNDPRNYHAHLLTTTREVLPTGLGAKTDLDVQGSERRARGLCSYLEELLGVRQHWAILTNEALRAANVEARIDHRSLLAQGIDREPTPRIPEGARRAEERGQRSEIAEEIRAAYRARVAARSELANARGLTVESAGSLEDIRQRARQSWLQLRRAHNEVSATGTPASEHGQSHNDAQQERDPRRSGPDDDLAI